MITRRKNVALAAMGTALALLAFGCANTAEDCALIGLCGGHEAPSTGGMGGSGGMAGAGGMAAVCPEFVVTPSAPEMQSAENVHIAPDGAQIVTGNFAGKLVLGPAAVLESSGSNSEFFLARYETDLTVAKALGIPAFLLDSAVDAQGNVLVIGTHTKAVVLPDACAALPDTSGLFVLKLDATNKCVWAKSYALGVGTEIAAHIAARSTGEIALAGAFSGSIAGLAPTGALTSVGTKDIFVAKLNANGDSSWGGSYGQAGQTQASRAVVMDASGDVLIAGDYQGTLNLNDPKFGTMMSANQAGFVAKFASNGMSLRWQTTFKVDSGAQRITAMALGESNDVILAGDIHGTSTTDKLDPTHRLFLAKLGLADGMTTLVRGYAGSGAPEIHGLAIVADKGFVLTGHVDDKLNFGDGELGTGALVERLFWTFLDENGANSQSRAAGDDVVGEKRGLGVAVNATHAFVVGHFEGTMNIAGQSRTSDGDMDMFVAELCLP